MSTTTAIRIGIVGAGANTRSRHIPNLKAQAGVEIVSVCNRSRESAEKVAKEFGIPRISQHWKELVESADIDAVVIGTWPYLHCPVTLAALAAGKHVLTEARMAMNASEARLMLEASRRNPHLVTQVVPSPYTLKIDRTVQKLLVEGFVGELQALEVRANAPGFLDRESPLHWRHDRDLSGLNILGMGIWYEAVMRWVGEAKTVKAMTRVSVRQRKDSERADSKPSLFQTTWTSWPRWPAVPRPVFNSAQSRGSHRVRKCGFLGVKARCATMHPVRSYWVPGAAKQLCVKSRFPASFPLAGAWKRSSSMPFAVWRRLSSQLSKTD